MNKTTTALTELIQFIENETTQIPPAALKDSSVASLIAGMNNAKRKAISLLQKERENMDVSFVAGAKAYYNRDFNITEAMHDAKGYFNRLFTQYKTTDNE